MPIYEFHCNGCNHEFEELVKVSTVPPCPECGSDRPARKISGFVAPRMPQLHAVAELRGPGSPPLAAAGHPGPTMTNCSIDNCQIGVSVGPGVHVRSHGLHVKNTPVAVDNSGVFEDTATVIE